MYRSFFALRERPFDLTPNPRFLYLTGRHREALSNVHYGVLGRKGITVLTGEAGTGKTTLVRAAIEGMVGRQVQCVYVSNPALTRAEFYEFLAGRFGLTSAAAASKARFLAELEEFILARHRAGGTVALVLDEAQSMPRDLMEEVRLLANLETDSDKLLPVVLAGQPELAARLEQDDLRQLKQRVALRCELQPLDLRETAAYISGRITIAGGEAGKIFTREAVEAIHEASRGIPRTISVICDNALVTAFAESVRPVGVGIVREVCRDFHFGPINGNGGAHRGAGDRPAGERPKPAPVVAESTAPEAPKPASVAPPRRQFLDLGTPERSGAGVLAGQEPAASEGSGAGLRAGHEGPLFGMFTKKRRFRFF